MMMSGQSKTNTERFPNIDLARGLSMLWIVAFAHLIEYVLSVETRDFMANNLFLSEINAGVIATFTFISGFCIKKYKFNNYDDIKLYTTRRFVRIYVLLFFASLSMFSLGSINGVEFLGVMTGLSSFLNIHTQTLWFVSMLMVFYLLTPIIGTFEKTRTKILVSLTIYIAFFALFYFIKGDSRLLIYMPFYFMGLLFVNSQRWKKRVPFLLSSSMLVLITVPFIFEKSDFRTFIMAALISLLILVATDLIPRNKSIIKLGTVFSYVSLCSYLFHRVIYHLYCNYVDTPLLSIQSAVLMVLLCLLMSYLIQMTYDRAILTFINHKH